MVISSGKGGTGKAALTGGIGTALSRLDWKVFCPNADTGLRNLDIACRPVGESVLLIRRIR